MTLSQDDLFEPLNNFFLRKYGNPESTSIIFRFDKFGSKVSQDDFREDPQNPDSDFLQALVQEKLSDLANRLPIESGDGATIAFLSDKIDDIYGQLLLQSLPYSSDTMSNEELTARIQAFSALKKTALSAMDPSKKLASVTGMLVNYWLTDFSPATWYNLNQNEGWSTHALTISGISDSDDDGSIGEPVRSTDAGSSGDNRPPVKTKRRKSPTLTWRAAPSEAKINEVAGRFSEGVIPLFSQQLVKKLRVPSVDVNQAVITPLRGVTPQLQVRPLIQLATPLLSTDEQSKVAAVRTPEYAVNKLTARDGLLLDLPHIRFDAVERIKFKEELLENAEKSAVTTSEVNISFEYTLVNMNRRWLNSTFLNTDTWIIPQKERGEANPSGQPGSLTLLPLAFVAIRNLSISASWTARDKEALKDAISWGPFEIEAGSGSSTVSQQGIQIIGWVLQRIPPLPPQPGNVQKNEIDETKASPEPLSEPAAASSRPEHPTMPSDAIPISPDAVAGKPSGNFTNFYQGSSATSEAFASAVGDKFLQHYQATGTTDMDITVHSPVTLQDYLMTCRDNGSYITCTGGNNAVVHIA